MSRIGRSVRVTKVITSPSPSVDTRGTVITAEEPLEVHVAGTRLVRLDRIPGDDLELVHGYLYTEGFISAAGQITGARYCSGAVDGVNSYNVIEADISLPAEPHAHPPLDPIRVNPSEVAGLLDTWRAQKKAFKRTGAALTAVAVGEETVARQDVVGHQAVDKLVGHRVLNGFSPAVIIIDARVTARVVTAAAAARAGALISTESVTSAAVEKAREVKLTMIGEATDNRFTLFAGELDG